jgi:hypothetical protein
MAPFSSPAARDAWAVIRGFVYQVDLTIQRWLELADNQTLFLEAGEDVDQVTEFLDGKDERLLEQIKVREGRLSLRSSEAVEVVANAIEHVAANAGLALRFRFTTTAQVAREQDHPEPTMPPGIELWERIRTSNPRPAPASHEMTTLRRLLSVRPQTVAASTWDVLADPGKLLALVGAFEWAMGSAAPEDQSTVVLRLLVTNGYAVNAEAAKLLYERLLAFTFRVLTRRGPKRLSRAELLAQVEQGTPSDEDRALVTRITRQLELGSIRIDALEGRVGRLEERLASAFGLPGAALALGVPDLAVDPPPLGQPLVNRDAVVADLVEVRSPWLTIDGEAGTGKSHLAVLTVRALGRLPVWVRLRRGSSEAEAGARLVRTLAAWAGASSLDAEVVLRAATDLVKSKDVVIVVDDLPLLRQDDALAAFLSRFADLVSARPVSLISLGVHSLPLVLTQSTANRCVRRSCPAFSESEAAELFRACGGEEFVQRRGEMVRRLAGFTRGHPTLLKAMASLLREREWNLDGGALDAIISGDYAAGTYAETQSALEASLPDAAARDLLARLKLQPGDFGREEIYAVAKVTPAINEPMRHLRSADGVWLLPTTSQRWRLSPLLKAIQSGSLAPDVERACHAALAQALLRHPLDQDSAATLVTHLISSDQVERAGFMLGRLLQSLADEEREVPPGFLLAVFWKMPLPVGMSVGVQISVRHAQALAGERYKRDTSWAVAELEALLSKADDRDAWAIVLVEAQRFSRGFSKDAAKAERSFLRAAAAVPRARLPDGSEYPMPDLAPLVWLQGAAVRTRTQLQVWLRLVARLPVAARDWRDPDGIRATTACQMACDRMWVSDGAKLAESHEALDEAIAAARAMNFPYLEACALRGKIPLLMEKGGDRDAAITLAEGFLKRHDSDPACSSLIEDALGRSCYHTGLAKDALTHLRRAIEHGESMAPTQLSLTLNYASRAAADAEPEAALPFSLREAAHARTSPEMLPANVVFALGELAIAEWYAANPHGCSEALLEAAELVQEHSRDTSFQRHAGVAFVQATTCLSFAILGRRQGTEGPQRPIPRRGFMHEQPGVKGVEWRADFLVMLAYQMCELASALGDEARARIWAGRALEHGARGTEHSVSSALQLPVLMFTLLSERDDAVLTMADGIRSLVLGVRALTGGDKSAPEIEAPSGLAVVLAVVPLAFAIATTAADNRQRATDLARYCAARLAELEPGSASPGTWQQLASLVRAPYEGAGHQDLSARGRALPPGNEHLRVLAHLQASLCEDVPLAVAAAIHGQILPWLSEGAPAPLPLIIARFAERYWTEALRLQRFAFGHPRDVERAIETLAPRPVAVRARRLLEVVADDLRVNLGERARQWCRSDVS